MSRRIVLLVSLAMAALLPLAACDDDGGGDDAPATSEATATVDTVVTTATGVPGGACSAAPLPATASVQSGLPPAVMEMRQAIIEEAVACNYDQLQTLALEGSPTFNYSFGEPSEGGAPGEFWEGAEGQGEDIMATLVDILNMPYAQDGGTFVWPFASTLDFAALTPDQRAMLEQNFTREEIDGWVQAGGYLGYRAGITQAGDWIFFVAGD
jgi:hypothetical protein